MLNKFYIPDQHRWDHHRHGWNFVVQELQKYSNRNGILLETTFDNKHTYDYQQYKNTLPITQPWVGFLHLTPNKDLSIDFTISEAFNHQRCKESLDNCLGLYTLSKYLKNHVDNFNLPFLVENLYLPTDLNIHQFRPKEIQNIIHLGHHKRKFESFARLQTSLNKITVVAHDRGWSLLKSRLNEKETIRHNLCIGISNQHLDELLISNVVFVDLFDSSANNTVVECIARNTPILINDHPAVKEYLGDDYPFYYSSLEEASFKLNAESINQAYEYLVNKDKNFLSIESFISDIQKSKIYQSL